MKDTPNDNGASKEFQILLLFMATLFAIAFLLYAFLRRIRQKPDFSKEDPSFIARSLDVLVWSFLWYGFSVSLVVYNKWLITSWEGGFSFPFTMSTIHMILKLLLVTIIVKLDKEDVPEISRSIYFCNAVPVGISTALDIAASNESYLFVSVPFYTVVKSSSLIFVLFFSILFKLQRPSKDIILVTVLISAGVGLAVYGEFEFSLIGFLLVLGASALGGFRWSLTQFFMAELEGPLPSLMTIYFISPAAAVTLLPFSAFLEIPELLESKFLLDPRLLMLTIANLLGAGLFAFAMIFVELELIKKTSSLSMAVISYVKQFLQILLSVMVFGAELSLLNVIGMLVAVLGMFCYTYIKLSKPNDRLSDAEPIACSDDEEDDLSADDATENGNSIRRRSMSFIAQESVEQSSSLLSNQ